LLNGQTPVLKWTGPFLFDIPGSQVDEFKQGHITGKDPFCLGDFANLTIKPFHGIGGKDDLSNRLNELKVLG
jgi:hypothetical protein